MFGFVVCLVVVCLWLFVLLVVFGMNFDGLRFALLQCFGCWVDLLVVSWVCGFGFCFWLFFWLFVF